MSLQKKFTLMIAATFSVLMVMMYFAARLEVIDHFQKYEQSHALRDAQIARSMLNEQQSQLDIMMLDYAMWDDCWAYMAGEKADFLDNLTDTSLARLKIHLVVFINSEGRIHHAISFDPRTKTHPPVPGGVEAYLKPGGPVLRPVGADDKISGIMKLSDGLMLVSAHPIVKTDGSGASHGWLIMGRRLDEAMLNKLARIGKQSLSLAPLEGAAATVAKQRGVTAHTRILEDQTVIGCERLDDLLGQSVAEVQVRLDRTIFTQCQTLINSLIRNILVIVIVATLFISFMMKKGFLNRLSHLYGELARIAHQGRTSERIDMPGRDEFRALADEINRMLDALMASSAALSQSEQRMRLSLAGSNVGVWDWNVATDQVVMVNHWFEILGHGAGEPETALGTLREYVHPGDLLGLTRAITTMFAGAMQFEHEFRVLAASGEWRWFLVRGMVNGRDAEGRPLRVVGMHLDVTARHRDQEELRRINDNLEARVSVRTIDLALANEALRKEVAERQRAESALNEAARRKDEFLAMLAHELRNPLAPIRSAVQVFQLAGDNVSINRRQWEMIDRQVTHMARLLDDLLDVSRITQGKIHLEKVSLELGRVVEGALETMQSVAQERGHTLLYQRPSDAFWVEGDTDRLMQVMCNLIHNAIKYTEGYGTIQIGARREAEHEGTGPMVVISVKDTGIGIAPEMLPHVFDLFMQADHSLDRTQGGLGIGLTLVHRLVQLHNGTVQALSEGLGRGSEFIIRLPLLSEAPAGATKTEPTGQLTLPLAFELDNSAMLGRRVLMVDDNTDTACSMAELLELWGYQVRVAFDGPAAIETALAFEPEIVLLDIGLPGMSGYDVARCIREKPEFASIMLVALTGYSQDEDRAMAREAGFDRFCTKPVDLHELRKVMEGFEAVEAEEFSGEG